MHPSIHIRTWAYSAAPSKKAASSNLGWRHSSRGPFLFDSSALWIGGLTNRR